jgi:hypothetical protein
VKHWDLRPNEQVNLVRQDGKKIGVRFLFRDTLHACFARGTGDDQSFLQFRLLDDGNLREHPSKTEVLRVLRAEGFGMDYYSASQILKHRKQIWVIVGSDRHTRTVLGGERSNPSPGRTHYTSDKARMLTEANL